jgi:putative flippase GtrA
LRPFIREIIGYAAASACALALDMSILWTLVHYFSWWYLAAATFSFLCGVVVSYVLSIKWAFKQHRFSDRRAEFMGFALLGTIGLGVNAIVIFIAVQYLGIYLLIAKGVAAGFTFLCNYISRRQFLFIAAPNL